MKNVSATVLNKLPRHSKARNIAHCKESTWTNIDMTSFAPEYFFWGEGQIENSITRLELCFVERKNSF